MTVRIATSPEEADRFDREFWAAMTPEDRVTLAWQLTLELWELKGWNAGEPGLRGPVKRIVSE